MMSFFGQDSPLSSSSNGAVVARSKKPVTSRPAPPPIAANGAGPSRSSTTGTPIKSSSNGIHKSKHLHSISSSHRKSDQSKGTSRPITSSSHGRSLEHSGKRSKSNTKTPSRTVSPIRSDSESSEDAFDPPKKKKFRTNGTPSGQTQTPELDEAAYGPEKQWCFSQVDERGEWGRGWAGFVPSEEVVRGQRRGFKGSLQGKANDLEKYIPWFPQEGFENKEPLPRVDLLYPSGCRETFVLLSPNRKGEYAPILELRTALSLILSYYIPPSHQHIFGSIVDALDLEKAPTPISQIPSPAPHSSATPPPDGALHTPPVSQAPSETIGNALRKAMAPNRRDGPGFMRAMERFNTAMEAIIADGSVAKWMETRPRLRKEDWSALVDGVHDEAYSRVVGPYANELEHHPKHPDEVARAITAKEDSYGELRHRFMSKVIEQTKLGTNSVFVDLGSGVGNCVLQAALEAGCRSYGFELLPVPAHCARLQLCEVRRRWSMWALNGNLDVEVEEGDFRFLPNVGKRLREADVVLVNNEVFPSTLNVDLTHLFLDLKDGAVIVSLQPLVSQSFKMSESNCDSFDAIVKMTQHRYYNDWVSWKGEAGNYYLQVVDRSMRRKFEEDLNSRRRRG
ncbi:S-adenosyl-L-methionine-dependent methyltransferase [Kockovaella imperatae]|uniref:Histone-lysine N-methyltransferase, H3 lysine-79 specific n=1 Tax=Kockovaella imperatae TaxID=4999 RepID=A0A1Y1UAX1_9TREE|nr:S-adenosyl-L-methionine-dependent methyltransferase [Kockovaella imperatae]ORX34694.1 S-adenosyl-L-methionine-dependent methyltransferase [Kockovaella imperatae]